MIEVKINKPLYGSYVNIRDLYLKRAIRKGEKLKITIPEGSNIVDPKEWIKTGKRVEQVFLRPNEPMVLYGNYVFKAELKSEIEKKKELSNSKLF